MYVCVCVYIHTHTHTHTHTYVYIVILINCYSTIDTSQIISKVPVWKDAIKVLMPIKNQWYMIGVALDISSEDLDSLKCSNNTDEGKLASMISTWLNKRAKKATWKVLIEAVEGKIVNNQRRGQMIREFLKTLKRSDPHSHSERGRILYNVFTK